MAAVTSRYARAFVEVVLGHKLDAAKVREELQTLQATLEESLDLRRVWETPSIPGEQKRRLLDAIVAREGLSRPVRNFGAVLIDHRRIGQLGQIVRQFEQEMDQRLGLAEAEITSSRELSAEEKTALEAQVERLVGRKVRASYATDPAVLGGAVVRVGSTIYDGTVRGQLLRIREQLSS